MARSADALRRDQVTRQAEGVGARVTASGNNSALQLASALQDIEPQANQALQNYAGKQRESAALQAKHDSLVASGAKLADAVRDGTIEPTSNPWYVQAYQRESAAVRGQSALSQLQLDSASWAEKGDPAAFAAKWRESVGHITEGFNSKDETAGFAPVEAQYTQQALQSNVSQNVTRITTERTQNLSALAASSLSTVIQKNGGTISANEATAALDPARIQWLATGGSQAEWNKMVVGAVTSAGYATSNAGVLDLLHAPELIHGASDAGAAPLGDGASGSAAPPLPITPITPVPAEAITPGKRWSSGELKEAIPFGGKFTSGVRSAAHNAEVGGKSNSQHLRGTAIDVVFPAGTSSAAVKAHYAAQGTSVDVIDEGDHFHIQGARNPTPLSRPQQPAVASAQAQDTPALATAPEVVSPAETPLRGPSLYDMTGVADQVSADRFRINQARETAQTERLRTMQTEAKVAGFNGYNSLYAAHGTKLLTGEVSSPQIVKEMSAAGYSPQAISEAIRLVSGDVGDNAALSRARLALNGSDPSTAKALMDLHVEATRNGLTPGLEDRVGKLVLDGVISGDDGAQIISKGISAARRNVEDNRQDANYAQAQQDRMEKATGKTKAYSALKNSTVNVTGLVTTRMASVGIAVTPKSRTAIQRRISDAAGAWLALHPEDFGGADMAARNAAADIVRKANAAKAGQAKPNAPRSATPTTGNARRTN